MCRGSVGIKVNDEMVTFVVQERSPSRRPLSLILLNLVAVMLAILIERAKENGIFEGVMPRLVDNGLSIF